MNKLQLKNIIGFSVDSLARSIYIIINNNKVARTEKHNDHMLIDYDDSGKIVGIELIRLKTARMKSLIEEGISEFKRTVPEFAQTL